MSRITIQTKPLKDALEVCIPSSNIEKFNQISLFVQLNIDADKLSIKHNAAFINSEVILKGSGDGESAIIINASLFKQLVSTLSSAQTVLEISDNALKVESGKNTFRLPSLSDVEYAQLATPTHLDATYETGSLTIKPADWKFVKDRQTYAVSENVRETMHYVFVGEDGTTIAGSLADGIFTVSKGVGIGKRCLLSESIINALESSLNETKLTALENSFVISSHTDAYDYSAEFTPIYEDEATNFVYPDTNVLAICNFDELECYTISSADLNNSLKQVKFFLEKNKIIKCKLSPDQLTISSEDVECVVPVESSSTATYTAIFDYDVFKSATNVSSAKFNVYPTPSDEAPDTADVFILATDELTTVIAGNTAEG